MTKGRGEKHFHEFGRSETMLFTAKAFLSYRPICRLYSDIPIEVAVGLLIAIGFAIGLYVPLANLFTALSTIRDGANTLRLRLEQIIKEHRASARVIVAKKIGATSR